MLGPPRPQPPTSLGVGSCQESGRSLGASILILLMILILIIIGTTINAVMLGAANYLPAPSLPPAWGLEVAKNLGGRWGHQY